MPLESSIGDSASGKRDRALLLPVLPAPLLLEFVCGGEGKSDVRDRSTTSLGSFERSSLPTKMAETGRELEGRRETDMGAQWQARKHIEVADDDSHTT